MARVSINVMTRGDTAATAVAGRLRAAGMKVDSILEEIGVVSGSIDPSKLADLRGIAGVEQVEESKEVHLPPPESDVQ